MTSNERVLVEYWLEIGKIRSEMRDVYDPAQGYRYHFLNAGIEFELCDT